MLDFSCLPLNAFDRFLRGMLSMECEDQEGNPAFHADCPCRRPGSHFTQESLQNRRLEAPTFVEKLGRDAMIKGRPLVIVMPVCLMLLNSLRPTAWAQSPALGVASTEERTAAAGMADIVYVPAKTFFCIDGGVSWLGVLILFGGTVFSTATDVMRAGCGGK